MAPDLCTTDDLFLFSTDFHNSFESHPSRKPFPSANLNPTVSTLPRPFESLTSYPWQVLTLVLPFSLNSTLQLGSRDSLSGFLNPSHPPNLSTFKHRNFPKVLQVSPRPLPPKPHGIISFADPHPLNRAESYRYKIMGGWGDVLGVQTFRPAHCFHLPKSFSCNTYAPPRKCCKQKTYRMSKSFK